MGEIKKKRKKSRMDRNVGKAPLYVLIVSAVVGSIAGHCWFAHKETEKFLVEARQHQMTEQQAREVLATGYVSVQGMFGGKATTYFGHPIRYGSFQHREYLMYGALLGLPFGIAGAIALAIFTTRNRPTPSANTSEPTGEQTPQVGSSVSDFTGEQSA